MFCGEIATLIPLDVELWCWLGKGKNEIGGEGRGEERFRREDFPSNDDDDDDGGSAWLGLGVVFVCATAQYPVSGLTAPLPLFLFRSLLRPLLLLLIAFSCTPLLFVLSVACLV